MWLRPLGRLRIRQMPLAGFEQDSTWFKRSLVALSLFTRQEWLELGASVIHAGTRDSVECSAKKKSLRLGAIAFASIIVVGWAVAAGAGVVIKGQDEVTRSTASPGVKPMPYTEMIEGKQAKIVIGSLQLIIDLATDKVVVLNARRTTTYYELPFPPPSTIGELILRRILPPMVKYKKTGKHLTLAGHRCDQFAGMGEISGAAYSVEACYSTDAPGAQDYTAFVKSAMAKAGNASAATSDQVPQGIPLELDVTITPKASQSPAVSQQQATPEKPVEVRVKTVVTSVASRSIEAAEFQTPAGLKLVQPPKGLGIRPHTVNRM